MVSGSNGEDTVGMPLRASEPCRRIVDLPPLDFRHPAVVNQTV